MENTEYIELYEPGGYHPVELGDKFSNRYVVEHKLGYGGYSTVWLARDLRQKRLVALKIIMADPDDGDGCLGDGDGCLETAILRRLGSRPQTSCQQWLWNESPFRSSSGDRPQPSFFPALLDEFTIHGPNGDHRCLVTEVLGPSICLADDYEEPYMLPLGVAKKIAVQLAHAVAELHECGIVHGGTY